MNLEGMMYLHLMVNDVELDVFDSFFLFLAMILQEYTPCDMCNKDIP